MQRHKRSMLAVSSVIVMLMVVVSVNSVTLRAQEQEFQILRHRLRKKRHGQKRLMTWKNMSGQMSTWRMWQRISWV